MDRPHGGSTGGGHGQDDGDDPTAPFRGPPSVSPSPSIADDDEPAGDGGGGAATSMSMQPIEPMDDDQHEQVPILPTPAGSVVEHMEEPLGQQLSPRALPPALPLQPVQPRPAEQPGHPLPAQHQPAQQPPGPTVFEQQRRRHERQETMVLPGSYGPAASPADRELHHNSQRGLQDAEDAQHSFDVDIQNKTKLPHGWKIANGYMVLEDNVMDSWEMAGNYLTR